MTRQSQRSPSQSPHQSAVKGTSSDHETGHDSYDHSPYLALDGVTGSAKTLASEHSGSLGLIDSVLPSSEEEAEDG